MTRLRAFPMPRPTKSGSRLLRPDRLNSTNMDDSADDADPSRAGRDHEKTLATPEIRARPGKPDVHPAGIARLKFCAAGHSLNPCRPQGSTRLEQPDRSAPHVKARFVRRIFPGQSVSHEASQSQDTAAGLSAEQRRPEITSRAFVASDRRPPTNDGPAISLGGKGFLVSVRLHLRSGPGPHSGPDRFDEQQLRHPHKQQGPEKAGD